MSTPIPRTRSELAPLLEARGLRLSRRLGQNFLVDPALADAIVNDAHVAPGDVVVEIGAGAGGLTQPLLAVAERVVAIEIDRGLAALLREYLGDHARLALVEGDALEGPDGLHPAIAGALDAPCDGRRLVVANLPYSCGTAVVSRLLTRDRAPDRIVAMLQREVVDRLRAGVGTADYGPLAVLAALRARVTLLRRVPPDVFLPRPAVESAVCAIDVVGPDVGGFAPSEVRAAVDLASLAFRQRRKRLAKALRGVVDVEVVVVAGLNPDARPETVPPEGWVRLATLAGRA